MAAKGAEKEEDELPPGFRFHPTDEELLAHYLVKKIADISFTGRAITDADLNKCEPWDLPAKAKMGEKEWYFFSLRDRKYPTGVRTNRATNAGYWKTTGKDKEIFSGSSMSSSSSSSSHLLGMKKTLVFYRGRAPRGEKSNWVMHEYRIHSRSSLRTPKLGGKLLLHTPFSLHSPLCQSHVPPSLEGSSFLLYNHLLATNGLLPNGGNGTTPMFGFSEETPSPLPSPPSNSRYYKSRIVSLKVAQVSSSSTASIHLPPVSEPASMLALA